MLNLIINVKIECILPVPDLPAEHARVLLLVSLYLGLDLGGGQLGLAAAQHARSDGASLLGSNTYDISSDHNSGPVSLSCQRNIALQLAGSLSLCPSRCLSVEYSVFN